MKNSKMFKLLLALFLFSGAPLAEPSTASQDLTQPALPSWVKLLDETEKPKFCVKYFDTNFFFAKCTKLPETSNLVALKYDKEPSLILDANSPANNIDFGKMVNTKQNIIAHFSHPKTEMSIAVQVSFDPSETSQSAVVIYYTNAHSLDSNMYSLLFSHWQQEPRAAFTPSPIPAKLKASPKNYLKKHGKTIGLAASLALIANISRIAYKNSQKTLPEAYKPDGNYENLPQDLAKQIAETHNIDPKDIFIFDANKESYLWNHTSIPDNTQLVVVQALGSSLINVLSTLEKSGILKEDTNLSRIKVLLLSLNSMDIKGAIKTLAERREIGLLNPQFIRHEAAHQIAILSALKWQTIIINDIDDEDAEAAESSLQELAKSQENTGKWGFHFVSNLTDTDVFACSGGKARTVDNAAIVDTRKPLLKPLNIQIETRRPYGGALKCPYSIPILSRLGWPNSFVRSSDLVQYAFAKKGGEHASSEAKKARAILSNRRSPSALQEYIEAQSHQNYLPSVDYQDGVDAGIKAADIARRNGIKYYAKQSPYGAPAGEYLSPNPFRTGTREYAFTEGYIDGANFEPRTIFYVQKPTSYPYADIHDLQSLYNDLVLSHMERNNPCRPNIEQPLQLSIPRQPQSSSPTNFEITEYLNELNNYYLYELKASKYLHATYIYVFHAHMWNTANPTKQVTTTQNEFKLLNLTHTMYAPLHYYDTSYCYDRFRAWVNNIANVPAIDDINADTARTQYVVEPP